MTEISTQVTEAHRKQYREKGYFVLEGAIPQEQLEMIRAKCDQFVRDQEEEMDRLGTDELELSRRGSRYFVFLAYKHHPELAEFIFSDLMAEICRATIGDNALLFWEQFVVKGTSGAKKGAFSWHQDAGYVDGLPVPPYVNAWVALDAVTEENGTVYLLPYDEAGTRDRVEHKVDPETKDRVGYFGDALGEPVIAPAGSIAVFSSTCFHRSGPNTTSQMRRAYALQFASDVVHNADGSVMGLEEPFLKDGKRVR
ncbi:MAG TPA: phytanoyl-CoA dioxygenase family protein [Rhodothermales bacterium]